MKRILIWCLWAAPQAFFIYVFMTANAENPNLNQMETLGYAMFWAFIFTWLVALCIDLVKLAIHDFREWRLGRRLRRLGTSPSPPDTWGDRQQATGQRQGSTAVRSRPRKLQHQPFGSRIGAG